MSDEIESGSDVSNRTGNEGIPILLIEDSPLDAEVFRRALSNREDRSFVLTHADQLEAGIDWLRAKTRSPSSICPCQIATGSKR